MVTRKHMHEETFPADPQALFALLHAPSAIRGWWGAARAVVVARPNGSWAAAWGSDEDNPDYVSTATIREFEPPRRMVLSNFNYQAKSGPLPFVAKFVTEFVVTSHADGAVLRVTQDGFPVEREADQFYAACEKGWHDTFAGIRAFLERPAKPGAAAAPSGGRRTSKL